MTMTVHSAAPWDPPGREERSIIVVSDLHLGSNEDHGTMARFCNFLDFLDAIDPGGKTPDVKDKRKDFNPCSDNSPIESGHTGKTLPTFTGDCPTTLSKPEKIILLGDSLDFWDSKDQNRDNVFFDAFFPLLRLRDMDCETVYVSGNHDEDMDDIIRCGSILPSEKGNTAHKFWNSHITPQYENRETGKELRGITLPWNKTRSLHIYSRAYDPVSDNGVKGINVGGISYSLVHGHQFDKEQVTATLNAGFSGAGLDVRADIVDYIEDVANISTAKNTSCILLGLVAILALFLTEILMKPPPPPSDVIIPWIGMWFGAVISFCLIFTVGLFGFSQSKLPSSRSVAIGGFLLACLLLSLVLLQFIFPWLSWIYIALFWVLLGISLYITIVVAIPCIIAVGKRKFYDIAIATRAKCIKELIDDGSFNFERFSLQSEVFVFGHTHKTDILSVNDYLNKHHQKKDKKWKKRVQKIEEILRKKPEGRKITPPVYLLNTGSWVNDPDPGKSQQRPEDVDTFVCIDSRGASLMKWYDKEKPRYVGCLCHISTDIIRQEKVKLQQTLDDIRKTRE